MSLSETYARVRPGIVAFAPKYHQRYKPDSLPYELIFGSGFIIGDSLIATNAHVIDAFAQFRSETGSIDVVAIMFLPVPQGMATLSAKVAASTKIAAVSSKSLYYGPPIADVGVVAVDCKGLSKYAFKLTVDRINEGIEVATAGFPMGPVLLHLEGQLDHLAPTLQRGIISAVLPFPGSTPHGYLVNIMVQGGASGSPVFLPETGEVIGAIYANRLASMQVDLPLPNPIHVNVPINFSHVVPSFYIQKLVAENSSYLLSSVSTDAAVADDLLKTIPLEVTEPMWRGKLVREWKSSG